MNIEIELAGLRLRLGLQLPETARYFQNYITAVGCPAYDVTLDPEDPGQYPLVCFDGVLTPHAEEYMLIARASQFLLRHRRVVIHGVSFLRHGKAWLITATSGTGKTTQLRHWQRLWPEEIELINGDKTVLQLREDGRLWLHPSPWTGKERDIGTANGELGGIVVLQQADHNSIRRLTPRESVLRVFQQFMILGDTEEEVRAACEIEDSVLHSVPVWLLENLGDETSAALTRECLDEYEAENHETV